MKLTISIFFLFILGAKGSVNAQLISINVKNISLQKVLVEISKQSKYILIYTEDDLKDTKDVTQQFKGKDLTEALDIVFEGQSIRYTIKGKSIVISRIPNKTSTTSTNTIILTPVQEPIKGKVINEKGEPLVGASIYVLDVQNRRTTIQTKTDENGNFKLPAVELGTKLEVFFLGYITEKISSRSDMGIISLKPFSAELEEVIVNTGYQDISKNSSTGAFEKIDADLLASTVSSDLLSRINNTSTGTYFHSARERFTTVGLAAKKDLSIHGVSTLYEGKGGSNAPLIILDNFPYEGDINRINPNEIESVTILKDAAASSIWGAKAGNGVIVITSKQASYNQPVQIKFRSDFQLYGKPDLYKHETINSRDYITVERELFEKGFYSTFESNPAMPVLSPVVELLIEQRDNPLSLNDIELKIMEYEKQDIRDDFLKYIYRNSVLQRYGVEMQGGSDRVKFVSGLGYDNSNAMFRGFSDERLSFRLDNTVKLLKKMELQTGVRWINMSERAPLSAISYSDNGYTIPYLNLVNEQGGAIHIPYQYRTPFIESTLSDGVLLDWRYNPIEESQNRGKHIAQMSF